VLITETDPVSDERSSVTAVSVSYNTMELTALLLWSLHRILHRPIDDVLIIDNGSTDGSADLLGAAADAGLCQLLANDRNIHHGPALNQALEALSDAPLPPQRVWILDSDVVIARADAADAAIEDARASGAAVLGEAHWDRWKRTHRYELHSLLLDLTKVWRSDLPGFTDDGDPSFELLEASAAAGHAHAEFPFAADGYVIHRGRGTLATIAASGDASNPQYDWALDHNEPHYGGIAGAREQHERLLRTFRSEVPHLTGPALVAACKA
jgi:hypothetical protein